MADGTKAERKKAKEAEERQGTCRLCETQGPTCPPRASPLPNVLRFRRGTLAQIARAEASLGGRLPKALRVFYGRQDGLFHYEEGNGIGLQVHGVERANLLASKPEVAMSEHSRDELLGYVRHWAETPPIVFETRGFRSWVLELCEHENELSQAVLRGFPGRFVCIASHWDYHNSYWVELDGPDDGPVYALPSPRFSLMTHFVAALREPHAELSAFLSAALAGKTPDR